MSEEQLKEKQRFDTHLRRLGERVYPSIEDGFDRELAKLRRVDEDVRSNLDEFYSASLGSSMAKNRFADVKPNEGTIVRLSESSAHGDGTYINANYFDARAKFNVPFVYIATQAPMKNTVLDFWRMVYENDAAFIVMLCGAKENGKVKSETYWPPRGETYDMGVLSVTLAAENTRPDSIYRRLVLRSVRGDEKVVYQMQYVAWPDQGVPPSSATLMEMIQAIASSLRSTQSPIVVHCSGGVGRTGVFIGLHIALAQFQLGQSSISVPRIVRYLKACRSGMVQRKDQYLFLYYSIQREMERMILSEKTGVNLLDSRPRLAAEPTARSAAPAPTQIASPVVMPVPLLSRSSRHMPSIFNLHRASTGTYPAELRSSPLLVATNRNADDDAALMEKYLLNVGSQASLPRSSSLPFAVDPAPSTEASQPVMRPATFSARSLSNATPREWDPTSRQMGVSRSSLGHASGSTTPALRSTSLLHEELARQKQANRVKRFSPPVMYTTGGGSVSAS